MALANVIKPHWGGSGCLLLGHTVVEKLGQSWSSYPAAGCLSVLENSRNLLVSLIEMHATTVDDWAQASRMLNQDIKVGSFPDASRKMLALVRFSELFRGGQWAVLKGTGLDVSFKDLESRYERRTNLISPVFCDNLSRASSAFTKFVRCLNLFMEVLRPAREIKPEWLLGERAQPVKLTVPYGDLREDGPHAELFRSVAEMTPEERGEASFRDGDWVALLEGPPTWESLIPLHNYPYDGVNKIMPVHDRPLRVVEVLRLPVLRKARVGTCYSSLGDCPPEVVDAVLARYGDGHPVGGVCLRIEEGAALPTGYNKATGTVPLRENPNIAALVNLRPVPRETIVNEVVWGSGAEEAKEGETQIQSFGEYVRAPRDEKKFGGFVDCSVAEASDCSVWGYLHRNGNWLPLRHAETWLYSALQVPGIGARLGCETLVVCPPGCQLCGHQTTARNGNKICAPCLQFDNPSDRVKRWLSLEHKYAEAIFDAPCDRGEENDSQVTTLTDATCRLCACSMCEIGGGDSKWVGGICAHAVHPRCAVGGDWARNARLMREKLLDPELGGLIPNNKPVTARIFKTLANMLTEGESAYWCDLCYCTHSTNYDDASSVWGNPAICTYVGPLGSLEGPYVAELGGLPVKEMLTDAPMGVPEDLSVVSLEEGTTVEVTPEIFEALRAEMRLLKFT